MDWHFKFGTLYCRFGIGASLVSVINNIKLNKWKSLCLQLCKKDLYSHSEKNVFPSISPLRLSVLSLFNLAALVDLCRHSFISGLTHPRATFP